MEFFNKLIWTIFHLSPKSLNDFLVYVGPNKLYLILCAILFAETGLVVTPFLPGDSLLFAVGAVGALPDSPLSLVLIAVMLLAAVFLGDNTNYWIGRTLGPAVFRRESSRLLNKKHLLRAHAFYETYGAKTIILARFVPIVRTFAPFVAGIGAMSYPKFLLFSVIGACLWVGVCISAGYALGQVEFVQKRFEVVIIVIVLISVMPMVIEFIRHRRAARKVIPGVAATGSETTAVETINKIRP